MKRFALIMAGGKGTRMKSEVPKQFMLINKKPVIVHTIEKFLAATSHIILVLPKNHLETWAKIQTRYFPKVPIETAIGGETRTDSVKSGLKKLTNEGLVAIHDAVRPFVSLEEIESSFNSAQLHGSGVVAVPLKDSIREVYGTTINSRAKNRENFVLAQTPQTFRTSEIKHAYDHITRQNHSDDATVYELAGYKVRLTLGNYANIKITTPEDLIQK